MSGLHLGLVGFHFFVSRHTTTYKCYSDPEEGEGDGGSGGDGASIWLMREAEGGSLSRQGWTSRPTVAEQMKSPATSLPKANRLSPVQHPSSSSSGLELSVWIPGPCHVERSSQRLSASRLPFLEVDRISSPLSSPPSTSLAMDGDQDGGRWERSDLNEYLEQERVQREAEHRQAEFDDQQQVYRGRPGEFFCSSVHQQPPASTNPVETL